MKIDTFAEVAVTAKSDILFQTSMKKKKSQETNINTFTCLYLLAA